MALSIKAALLLALFAVGVGAQEFPYQTRKARARLTADGVVVAAIADSVICVVHVKLNTQSAAVTVYAKSGSAASGDSLETRQIYAPNSGYVETRPWYDPVLTCAADSALSWDVTTTGGAVAINLNYYVKHKRDP